MAQPVPPPPPEVRGGPLSPVPQIDLTCGHRNCEHKGVYQLPVRCSNCGLEGNAMFTKTHEALVHRCPNCETYQMRPTRG